MRIRTTFLLIAAVLAVTAPAALAQSESGIAVAVSGGIASGTSNTGAALGGSMLFDINERVSIEGQGTYLDRGAGADGFTVGGGLLVNLLRSREPVVPYAVVGGGVYHVSYDLANPRFLGPAGTQFAAGGTVCPAPGTGFGFGPGPGLGAGARTCPGSAVGYWGVGALPQFYARRLGPLAFPRSAAWDTRTFTDPALSVGGGLRVNITDRLMFRPALRAVVVFADGETHTLGVFVVNVGYRF